jgi:hypothetical protein
LLEIWRKQASLGSKYNLFEKEFLRRNRCAASSAWTGQTLGAGTDKGEAGERQSAKCWTIRLHQWK